MPEASAGYRPIAEHLPAIYQEDADSWEQVQGFLGLLDDVYRSYLGALGDLTTLLSPEARLVQPPGVDAGQDPTDAYRAAFAELADWFAWAFPASWASGDDDTDLARQREFLLRVARLWRRRGTPSGFYSWFCFYFQPSELPILLEHFKYRPPNDDSGSAKPDPNVPDEYAHRVTLLVPRTSDFDDYRRRREVVQFVAREAPAHLLFRVCWVPSGFSITLTSTAVVRNLLTTLAGYVAYDDGIHLDQPPAQATVLDRLGSGQLPGGGTTT